MLSVALAHHAGALRASLAAVYGIRDYRECTPTELADFVAWLPQGSALWRSFGGPAALTVEQHELRRVTFMLRVLDFRERGSKGEKPKPDPDPQYAHEKRAKKDAMTRKAAAYQRRQARAIPRG